VVYLIVKELNFRIQLLDLCVDEINVMLRAHGILEDHNEFECVDMIWGKWEWRHHEFGV
jgi:hypothetical protein